MSKVTQYAHRELERNLAWVLAGEAEERADYVATMSNPLHRFATQGLLAVAKAMPNGVARALDREVGDSGLLYLGAGSKNTVLLDAVKEEVVKIHRASAFMSEEQRQKLAEVTNVRHRKLRNYLGDMAVEQGDFEVAPHPLARRSETRAVIGRQKVLSFIPLDVFSGYGPDVDPQAYSRLVKDFPETASSLAILATYGLELIEDEGLVPDVSGMHNVVLDMATKDVKVMGSVPLAVHEHVTQAGLIQSQLRQILELTPSESL